MKSFIQKIQSFFAKRSSDESSDLREVAKAEQLFRQATAHAPKLRADVKQAMFAKIEAQLDAKDATAKRQPHFTMPAIFFAGPVRFGLVLGVLVLAVVGGWSIAPAPQAFGAYKGQSASIYRNSAIRVIFSLAMQHESAERAFRISPPINGSFSWQGNVMSFRPAQTLEKGAKYEVTVGEEARSMLGKQLGVPFRQFLTVLDFPEVSIAVPVDGSEVNQDQTITIMFDHPIRSLNESLAVPEVLRVEPAVSGTYRWVGTSGFEFVPNGGLPAATNFTVTLPRDVEMIDGSSLVEDYRFSFFTPNLSVTRTSPYMGNYPKDPVSLQFNYEVNPAEIANGITIYEDDAIQDKNLFSFSVAERDPKTILISRRDGYRLGHRYVFTFPMGYTAGLGPRGLVDPFRAEVLMDELGFRVKSVCPGNGGVKVHGEQFAVVFNNRVDAEKLADRVRISPELPNAQFNVVGYAQDPSCATGDGRGVFIYGDWKPSTQYTVTFVDAFADIYGQRLEGTHAFTFTTAPYPPSLELASYSDFGLLANHLPHVYQVRARNLSKPISVRFCELSFEQYVRSDRTCANPIVRTYDMQAPQNQFRILDLSLDEVSGKALGPGYYSFEINAPDLGQQWGATQSRSVVITDTALTLKTGGDGKELVWATDLRSGALVSDLPVELWRVAYSYDVSGRSTYTAKKIADGKTGADGVARVVVPSGIAAYELFARAADGARLGVVGSAWEDGISPWNYGLQASYEQRVGGYVGYIYSDRRIYRPDHTVNFKGVLRQEFDAQFALPKLRDVEVHIENPEYQQVTTMKLPISEYGTFHGSFKLDPTMKLGDYRIWIAPIADGGRQTRIEQTFTVAEYRRPDFKVTVAGVDQEYVNGDTMNLSIGGEYYYGAPLVGGKVSYSVSRRSLFFQPMQGEWYNYTKLDASDCYWYCRTEQEFQTISSGTGVLDANGVYRVSVPLNLNDYKSSAMYTVSVTIEDVNGRTVSSTSEVKVHKGQFYIGVRANYDAGWASATADYDLVTVETNGSRRARVPVSAKLYHRTWSNVKKTGADGSYFMEYEVQDTLIETKQVMTDDQGEAKVRFTPAVGGEYVLVAEARDGRGNLIASEASRWVDRGASLGIKISDDHQLKVIQNKADYNVGDTASLAVQTPYEHTKALVTVERDTIREYRVVDLDASHRTIDIPITDTMSPNIYVSVLTVQGSETSLPEFRLGYASLQVSTTKKQLQVTLTPERTTYRPGDEVVLRVETKKSDGTPAPSELSLAVVDERVVALLGSVDKNILGKFYFQRSIGVRTAQSLTKLVRKVFFATEGGGGKGGDGEKPVVRTNFLDTAFWKADVVTNAAGVATVKFTLPDNLTTWQVLAIGVTKDTVVGSAETSVRTKKDLMAEPLLPRFVRNGDALDVGATIFNATNRSGSFEVELLVNGVTLKDAVKKRVSIDAGNRAPVLWHVEVPAGVKEAKFEVRVNGLNLSDAFAMTLPVHLPATPEVVTASGILEEQAMETLEVPHGVITEGSSVRVAVTPNVGNGLQGGIDFLNYFPYGCAEQLSSALSSNLVYEELVKLRVIDVNSEALLAAKKNVNDAIAKIVSQQRADGGWGYWTEGNEYPHLTAYVLLGLHDAETAGFAVDPSVLSRAEQYLRLALSKDGSADAVRSANEKAEVLYAISEVNPAQLGGYATSLYERRKDLALFGKLRLALALGNIERTSSVRGAKLLAEVRNSAVLLDPATLYLDESDAFGYFMSSDVRSSALYLRALLKLDPKNADVDRLAHYLMKRRFEGRWQTTQDTAQSLLALVEYVRSRPLDVKASAVTVYLDNAIKGLLAFAEGDRSSEQSLTIPMQELSDVPFHQIGLEKDSSARYFYDISMRMLRPIADIQSFDNGFTILSEYYASADVKHEQQIAEAGVGDIVRVRMKVFVPKRRQYVAVENFLPAGLEAIDMQLKTSTRDLDREQAKCSTQPDANSCLENLGSPWWGETWQHKEFRDDRVFLFAEELAPGLYEYEFLARAVTPGEFFVPPAQVYEFYDTTVTAHNEGKTFHVSR